MKLVLKVLFVFHKVCFAAASALSKLAYGVVVLIDKIDEHDFDRRWVAEWEKRERRK
jgi:hypothetical protein